MFDEILTKNNISSRVVLYYIDKCWLFCRSTFPLTCWWTFNWAIEKTAPEKYNICYMYIVSCKIYPFQDMVLPAILALVTIAGLHPDGKVYKTLDVCSRNPIVNGCSVPLGFPMPYRDIFKPACDRHDICHSCVSIFFPYSKPFFRFAPVFIRMIIYNWVDLSWIGCLTSQLTIFQSYMWRHIDVQADWRRSWTYGRARNAIDISKGSLTCPS